MSSFYIPEVVKKWRTCEWKKAYTLEQAQQQCKKFDLYYYKCPYCDKYHTTKTPTYESIMEVKNDMENN